MRNLRDEKEELLIVDYTKLAVLIIYDLTMKIN
jgi:hypothetical protein